MINAVIVGFGNIGRFALEAIEASDDMKCVGIVRRGGAAGCGVSQIDGIPVVADVDELGCRVDVAILSVPSRKVEQTAMKYLAEGISTVDSFDIHSQIPALRKTLSEAAQKNNAVAVISAGWDPGSDSVVRCLLQALAPQGQTFTNFGPGRSMGHTVAAKAVPGVKDALSMTIPCGGGVHSRHVYIEVSEGYDFEQVAAAIKADPYFASDVTEVELVPSVEALNTLEHGVLLVREGTSGKTQNQKFSFDMRINNPALTGQAMVASARAALRLNPGCYTLPEIPPIDFLPGSREEWVAKLV